MTIEALTSTIPSYGEQRRRLIIDAADRIIERKSHAERRKRIGFYKHMHFKAAVCSKCQRGMDNKLARTQKENKREFAPICIPCILGKPRKPLLVKEPSS